MISLRPQQLKPRQKSSLFETNRLTSKLRKQRLVKLDLRAFIRLEQHF
jgi:hypothetical protein